MKASKYAAAIAPIVLVTYFAIRAGLPEQGYCQDAEMLVAELDDAGEYVVAQRPWRICNVDGADASLTEEQICVVPAKDVCLGDWRTVDAGPRTAEQKACLDRERAQCKAEVPQAGQVIWLSEPFPMGSETQRVRPLTRRDQFQNSCMCPRQDDAGPCKVWRDGADASVPMKAGDYAPPGKSNSRGCTTLPCSESLKARKYAGEMYPEICRPQ